MKKMMPVILAVLMVLSIYMLIDKRIETKNTYEGYIAEARELGEMGVVVRSAAAYDNALGINETGDLALEKGEMYFNNGHISSALAYAEELVDKYPKKIEVYEFLLKLYLQEKEYTSFFATVDEVSKRKLKSEIIDNMVSEIRYSYSLGYTDFEEAMNYSDGFWPVFEDGLWGYLDSSGRLAINLKYKNVNPFVMKVASVEEMDGTVYYIDAQGEKTNVPDMEGNITELGVYVNPIAIAVDDKYGYYTDKFEHKFGEYDYASSFNMGIAAVKNGTSWSFIKDNGELVSGNEYVDVIIDEKEVAFRNERAFVAFSEGEYYLIDTLENKITENSFDYAEMFLSEEPAAVKIGNKWGFVNLAGELVIDAQYDDAHSFINGFAAVCKGGKWGYIDTENNVCIDFVFDDALNFNEKGVSLVKNGDSWVSLTLYNTKY